MRVCVSGLWHLGTVTAACLAAAGHDVIAHDPDPARIGTLRDGIPPVHEPGLEALLRAGIAAGRLTFTTDGARAAQESRLAWIAHDTPVGDADRADPTSVERWTLALIEHLAPGSLVLVSSQVPVGTTRRIAEAFRSKRPGRTIHFAYSPENLRLGSAIESFTHAERIVVGLNETDGRTTIEELLAPLQIPIAWMSVASAEMAKHALNAYLAVSVAFANEIAAVCESVGADAVDVTDAMRGDPRIGQKAYLGVGTGYAGGTLGRDVIYLADLLSDRDIYAPVLASIAPSNAHQQSWVRRTLAYLLGDLQGKRIGVWGLTYKPDTDTLRRSAAVELCEWLVTQGAHPSAHDPAIHVLPPYLARLALLPEPLDAIRDADALVVMTPWPVYQSIPLAEMTEAMRDPVIVDPGRHLGEPIARHPDVRYAAVGRVSG